MNKDVVDTYNVFETFLTIIYIVFSCQYRLSPC